MVVYSNLAQLASEGYTEPPGLKACVVLEVWPQTVALLNRCLKPMGQPVTGNLEGSMLEALLTPDVIHEQVEWLAKEMEKWPWTS